MAIFNLTASTPEPVLNDNIAGAIVAAGSETYAVNASIGGYAQTGVLIQPTGSGPFPFGIFCRGGKQGADSQLTDSKILGDSTPAGASTFGTHIGLSGLGVNYTMICPDYREGAGLRADVDGSPPVSAGTDNFGVSGEDVEDVLQWWSARYELTKANSAKTFAMGTSAGCMRLLLAMAEGLSPDVCILRAPFINLASWEPNRNGHAAIPDFEGDADTAWDDLTQADKNRLKSRSPMQRTDELPVIPYLLIYGENDATVPRSWVNEFRDRMVARGAEVQVVIVPGGTHALAAQAVGTLSTAAEKSRAVMASAAAYDFLAKHLA